jgi:hypothetical protein
MRRASIVGSRRNRRGVEVESAMRQETERSEGMRGKEGERQASGMLLEPLNSLYIYVFATRSLKGRKEGSPSSGGDGNRDGGGSFGNDGIKVSYLLPQLTWTS